MKKILTSTLLGIFVTLFSFTVSAGTLLWKVSGNGLEKSSYVFGSHHAAPASMVDSVAGLREAIANCDIVMGEISNDNLTQASLQQKMMIYAIAPADSTLSVVLGANNMARLDSLLASYTGMPGLATQFESVKPAVVSAQLALLQISRSVPEFNAAQAFDSAVMGIGEQLGKPNEGLETVESQLEILFGDPISVQAENLIEAIDNDAKSVEQALVLTNAYIAQDLDAITAISLDPDFGIEADDLDRLLYNRNRNWADKLAQLLPQGESRFIIVGAAHLGGEQGLLNLLRNLGYTVEPVANN